MREKWVKASATIVESADNPGYGTGPAFHDAPDVHEYVIELVTPQGTRRAAVSMFGRFVHEPGAVMHVEVNAKTGEIKADHDAMTKVAVQLMKEHPEAAPGHARRAAPAAAAEGADKGGLTGQPAPVPSPSGVQPPGTPRFDPGPPGPLASASPFDTDGGDGPPEQRIARLRQLLEKGILTETEFQAKRRQILG